MNIKTTSRFMYGEANKAYEEFVRTHAATDFKIEIERYKKMLNIFEVGDFFYVIFNLSLAQIEHCGKGVAKVLGFTQKEFTPQLFLEQLHPEDAGNYMAFETKVNAFFRSIPPDKIMNYKTQYDFRIKRKDKRYVRIMQQEVAIHITENGAVLHTLIVFTDITHLKKSNQMSLSLVGLNEETSYADGQSENTKVEEVLSSREKEVLALLSQNKTSDQIADELCISKHTVDNHRKKMLRKTATTSTLQLVMRSVEEGWL